MTIHLLIADPPHTPVNAGSVAGVLGLAAAELNVKVHHQAPEIWFADEDSQAVRDAADAMRAAGLRVAAATGEALATIPEQQVASSFTLGDVGLTARAGGEQIALPYDRFWTVLFTPRGGAGPGVPHGFADLYVVTGERRLAVVAGETDFSGLGAARSPSALGSLMHFVQDLDRRLPADRVDRRLMNLQLRQPRHSQSLPIGGACARKGYSYASQGLVELLERIDPSLTAISHPELSSRLVYLTLRAHADEAQPPVAA